MLLGVDGLRDAVQDWDSALPACPGTRLFLWDLGLVRTGSSSGPWRVLSFTAHPERAALLFVSSVCIGLALTLCALVVRVSCTKDLQELQLAREHLVPGSDKAEEDSQDEEGEEDSSDSDFPGELSGFCRTTYPVYSSIEAAELAERIERREQIIQEIWMNSGLDTSLPRNMGQFYWEPDTSWREHTFWGGKVPKAPPALFHLYLLWRRICLPSNPWEARKFLKGHFKLFTAHLKINWREKSLSPVIYLNSCVYANRTRVHIYRALLMPGTVLVAFHALSYLILRTTSCNDAIVLLLQMDF